MIIDTVKAIQSLTPTAEWTIVDDEITWISGDITQPTLDEINAEITRLQAEYDAQAYARKRKEEYPTIEECIHAILDDDLTALQVKRQTVKDKYSKP
tara:strand:+ start:214 stop:504 length:291 start_codon:yes stop_codon:yes gene_type:complete